MSLKEVKTNVAGLMAASILAAGMAASQVVVADDDLTAIDSLVSTYFDKSVISGSIATNDDGQIILDGTGKLMFNYTGDVYSIETNEDTAELKEMSEKIGTIAGQAAFPMEFAHVAIGMYAFLTSFDENGQPTMDMPSIPASMDWTCNQCTMVVGDNTYKSVVDVPGAFGDATEDLRMEARAFLGLGPVEIGQIKSPDGNGLEGAGLSMSVRLAGCSAVIGVDGPDAGKVGTLCLNGTVAFDLSGINLDNPFMSTITGTGTSNCVTVMHTPMQM